MRFIYVSRFICIKEIYIRITKFLSFFLLFFLSGILFAQSVPGLINYQGRLTDSSGLPVNGTREIHFALLDADTFTASVLWSETQNSVQVSKGIYNVILGSTNPLSPSIIGSSTIYLEVKISGETLRPRSRMTGVLFSHKAGNVVNENDTLDSVCERGYITDKNIKVDTSTIGGTKAIEAYSADTGTGVNAGALKAISNGGQAAYIKTSDTESYACRVAGAGQTYPALYVDGTSYFSGNINKAGGGF